MITISELTYGLTITLVCAILFAIAKYKLPILCYGCEKPVGFSRYIFRCINDTSDDSSLCKISSAIDTGTLEIMEDVDQIVIITRAVFHELTTNIPATIKAVLSTIINKVEGVAQEIIKNLTELATNFGSFIENAFMDIKNEVITVASDIYNRIIQPVIDFISSNIINPISDLIALLIQFKDIISSGITQIVSDATGHFVKLGEDIVGVIGAIPDGIEFLINQLIDGLNFVVGSAVDGTNDGVQNVVSGLVGTTNKVIGFINTNVGSLVDSTNNATSLLSNGINSAVTGAVGGVVSGTNSVVGVLNQGLTGLSNDVNLVTGTISSGVNTGIQGVNSVITTTNSSIDTINLGISGLVNDTNKVTANIAGGINDAVKNVSSAIIGTTNSAIVGINGAMGTVTGGINTALTGVTSGINNSVNGAIDIINSVIDGINNIRRAQLGPYGLNLGWPFDTYFTIVPAIWPLSWIPPVNGIGHVILTPPQISVPTIPTLSSPNLPSLSFPPLTAPVIGKIPILNLPSVTIPKISIPTIPQVAMPTLPKLTIPSIVKPNIGDITPPIIPKIPRPNPIGHADFSAIVNGIESTLNVAYSTLSSGISNAYNIAMAPINDAISRLTALATALSSAVSFFFNRFMSMDFIINLWNEIKAGAIVTFGQIYDTLNDKVFTPVITVFIQIKDKVWGGISVVISALKDTFHSIVITASSLFNTVSDSLFQFGKFIVTNVGYVGFYYFSHAVDIIIPGNASKTVKINMVVLILVALFLLFIYTQISQIIDNIIPVACVSGFVVIVLGIMYFSVPSTTPKITNSPIA